jgi:aromatic ring-opening dioxygenase catalytic subunit (LigB family)
MAGYLQAIPQDIGVHPKAIVLISGHWEEEVVTIQNNCRRRFSTTIMVFLRTQRSSFRPGAPALSCRIGALLGEAGVDWKYDHARGFDHGVFIR